MKQSIPATYESPEENSFFTEEEVKCANPNDPQMAIKRLNDCIEKIKLLIILKMKSLI